MKPYLVLNAATIRSKDTDYEVSVTIFDNDDDLIAYASVELEKKKGCSWAYYEESKSIAEQLTAMAMEWC